MEIKYVFFEILKNLLLIAIFAVVGTILAWVKAFDKIGENRSAEANIHVFIPVFCFVAFSQAVYNLSSNALGLLFFTFVISASIGAVLAFIFAWVSRMDVRIIAVFMLMAAYGNVAFIPESILVALCGTFGYGSLQADAGCKHAGGYSLYVLFLFNYSLICIGPFFMHMNKAKAFNIRRQMIMIREFYSTSPADFMADTELVGVDKRLKEGLNLGGDKEVHLQIEGPPVKTPESPEKKEGQEGKPNNYQDTESALHTTGNRSVLDRENPKVPMSTLEEPELIVYSLEYHMDPAGHEKFQKHFDKFIDKFDNRTVNLFCEKHVPSPEKPMEFGIMFILGRIYHQVNVGCILGIIIGRINAAEEWFYCKDIISIFMGPVESIANLAIPIAVMILGIQLATGFSLRGMSIRVIDIAGLIVIRHMILPAIGIGFARALYNDGIWDLQNDGVLAYSIFANWNLPPGILLLTLFVLCGYFAREGSFMIFCCLVATIPLVTLFTWAYLKAASLD